MRRARSARHAFWNRWNFSSKTWRRQRPRNELVAKKAAVQSFQRKRPSRKPFRHHLPRERIVIAAPESCPCCGSAKLPKLGEDITETR